MDMATGFNSGYPGYADREGFSTGRDGARFRFGHVFDTTGGTKTRGFKVDMPLYAWASVIVNGRVVATDYAPDTGFSHRRPELSQPSRARRIQVRGFGNMVGGLVRPHGSVPGLSMNVAAGWTIVGDPRFYHAGGVTRDDGRIRFVMVDTLTKDACAKREGAIDGRANVDDIVAAFLARLPLIDVQKNARSRSTAIAGSTSSSRGRPVRSISGWEARRLAGEFAKRPRRGRPGVDPRHRWRSSGDRRVLLPGRR